MGRVYFKTNYIIENADADNIRNLKRRSELAERTLYIGKIVNIKIKSIGEFNGQTVLHGHVYNDNGFAIAKSTCYYKSLSDEFKNFIDEGLIQEGDFMKLYITAIKRKETYPDIFTYYVTCSDKKPSDNRINQSKENIEKNLKTPFIDAKCASATQNIPVEIKISITDHAILREKERLDIHWDDVLLKTDFVEKTIQSIINDSTQVNMYKKFIFQNNKTNVTSVLYCNNIDLTEDDVLSLEFTLITLWKGLYDDRTHTHRNQYIIKGDSSSIAYKTIKKTSNLCVLRTIVPIKFNVEGDNNNRAMAQQLSLTNWNNSNPLTVAVGCIRKTLPQIFLNNILKRQGRTFTCYEASGPIYVGVRYNGKYEDDNNCLSFKLIFIQYGDNFKRNGDEHIYTTQDHYYNIVKSIKNSGTLLKQENYIDKKVIYK